MEPGTAAIARRRGQRLLQQLLPWARAEARKEGQLVEWRSALGSSAAAHVTEDNLDALVIYPAPLGGWHADVVFKHVPPGIPNSMGTMVGRPCRTQAEAEEAAKSLLVTVLRIAMAPKSESDGAPVFLLHGCSFTMPAWLYTEALAAFPKGAGGPGGGYETADFAIQRIEETLAEHFPAGFTAEAFNAANARTKATLVSVLQIATLTGVYAYPPRVDASPSGHAAPSTARH